MQQPTDMNKYAKMLLIFSNAESKNELETMAALYIQDMSDYRESIVQAMRTTVRDKGWSGALKPEEAHMDKSNKTAEEIIKEEIKEHCLKDLKVKINTLLWETLPTGISLGRMEKMSLRFHDEIISEWEKTK